MMMIIRQSIFIISTIIKGVGKLKTHSPTYCIMDNWENMLNSFKVWFNCTPVVRICACNTSHVGLARAVLLICNGWFAVHGISMQFLYLAMSRLAANELTFKVASVFSQNSCSFGGTADAKVNRVCLWTYCEQSQIFRVFIVRSFRKEAFGISKVTPEIDTSSGPWALQCS